MFYVFPKGSTSTNVLKLLCSAKKFFFCKFTKPQHFLFISIKNSIQVLLHLVHCCSLWILRSDLDALGTRSRKYTNQLTPNTPRAENIGTSLLPILLEQRIYEPVYSQYSQNRKYTNQSTPNTPRTVNIGTGVYSQNTIHNNLRP